MTDLAPPPPTSPEPTPSGIGSHQILTAGVRKWLMVALIGAGFVAIGIVLIVIKGDFLAWFVTLFFGLVAAVGVYQLAYPGTLALDAETFTVTGMGRTWTEQWEECRNFVVYRTGHNNLVAYDRTRDVGTHMAEMNRMLSGGSAGLPDTFGLSAHELAGLMNTYHAAAIERAWQRHGEAVAAFSDKMAAELTEAGEIADIITDPDRMSLADDMPPWPSIIVVRQVPREDGRRDVLLVADLRSPIARWLTEAEKRRDAFEILGAEELQIVDPYTMQVRRIPKDRGNT